MSARSFTRTCASRGANRRMVSACSSRIFAEADLLRICRSRTPPANSSRAISTGSPNVASATAYRRGTRIMLYRGFSGFVDVIEKSSVDITALEVGMSKYLLMQRNGCARAFNDEHIKGASHSIDRFGTVCAIDNQLRDQRVVVRRNDIFRIGR